MREIELKEPELGQCLRLTGKLIDVRSIKPKPVEPVIEYIFEECSFCVEHWLDDTRISSGSTYNDFYGYEAGINEAIKECKNKTAIHPSLMGVVVLEKQKYKAKKLADEDMRNKGFYKFESIKYGSIGDPIRKIIWSSNEGFIADFHAYFNKPRTNGSE